MIQERGEGRKMSRYQGYILNPERGPVWLVLQNYPFTGGTGVRGYLMLLSYHPSLPAFWVVEHWCSPCLRTLEVVGGAGASVGLVSTGWVKSWSKPGSPPPGRSAARGHGHDRGGRQVGLSKFEEVHKWCLTFLPLSRWHIFFSKQSPQLQIWGDKLVRTGC